MNAAPWFDFDISEDPVFIRSIRPFILSQLDELRRLDDQRRVTHPYIKYIFHEHAERVAEDVRAVCQALGQPENVQEAMYWAMLAHDIGKTRLPADIWDSYGKPTDQEKKQRRRHTSLGLEVIGEKLGHIDHPFIDLMRDIVANHHENMDGSGFIGLHGDRLSTPVRLACIVESFDGYSIPRPHFGDRDISPAAVLEKMRSEPDKGAKMFDMELFDAFTAYKIGNSQTEN